MVKWRDGQSSPPQNKCKGYSLTKGMWTLGEMADFRGRPGGRGQAESRKEVVTEDKEVAHRMMGICQKDANPSCRDFQCPKLTQFDHLNK